MIIFVILVFIFAFIFVPLRVALFHPFKTVLYGIKDIFLYVLHKRWHECESGYIRGYTGLFGKGKTLSATHYIILMYLKFNNKKVYCTRRKKMVTQKIQIVSNVPLSIPYENLKSLKQLVYIAENKEVIDDMNDTLTVSIGFIDEASVQLNSRQFKNNIDALFLNTLLTCRHFHMGLLYSAQRFIQTDALLRQVTSEVVECCKVWRFQKISFYDAWELENATTPKLVEPICRKGWFVRDRDYNAYNTYATVNNLSKSCENGDMLKSDEIIALQCNNVVGLDAVTSPSKKLRRLQKKSKK